MTIATSRLPGTTFQVVPPTPQTVLPRMDIAAFVGLASSGPLHTPVAVEDPVRFRDLFGPDLTLAWDAGSGQPQIGYLGKAVEAFFSNGGRRCWIVRVADAATAKTSRFVIPGLIEAGSWRPGIAQARSPGGWADALTVGTMEEALWLDTLAFSIDSGTAGEFAYRLEVRGAPGQIQPGDLVRCRFEALHLLFWMPVDSVAVAADRLVLHAIADCIWLQIAVAESPPLEPIKCLQRGVAGEAVLPHIPGSLVVEETGAALWLDIPLARAPAPGDVLWIHFDNGTQGFLPVASATLIETGSPLQEAVEIRGMAIYLPLSTAAAHSQYEDALLSPLGAIQAERVRFALWVWEEQAVKARMEALGFQARHKRYWANLPTDEQYFQLSAAGPGEPASSLAQEAAQSPRFPLAGPQIDRKNPPVFLPLGMGTSPDREFCRGPFWEAASESRLVRDGLGVFDAGLFLDPRLDRSRLNTLITEADHLQHVMGESLCGIHALLPIEEVTLVAVPDAVHLGWKAHSPEKPSILPPPFLGVCSPPESDILSWSAISEATDYLLERAGQPDFAQPEVLYTGTATWYAINPPQDCAQTAYFRVQARRSGQRSPWSNTWVQPPALDFQPCQDNLLEAPSLQVLLEASPPSGRLVLGWDLVAGAEYELQEGQAPGMEAAQMVYKGAETEAQVWPPRAPVLYYRVRAIRGETISPWSNTCWFVPPPEPRYELLTPENYDACSLLDIQRALLRLCAARGDLFALFALPRHFSLQEAKLYRASLGWTTGGDQNDLSSACRIPPFNPSEKVALGFGALYHPWLAARREGSSPSSGGSSWMPPQGAVGGSYAKRALERGAWIAPANEPLANIIALSEMIDRAEWANLLNEQINVIREDPRGYMVLSAVTLHAHPDYKPINVRRLLILLRRLAFREGMRFVFQNNDAAFRRLVASQFEAVLADLFARGAFKGHVPETAYQVNTELPTTPQDQEQGRLIVELRIAPSRPMSFITVRLVQQGNEGLRIEER